MPSDRLLRFRQYMAAFEGSADPAKSIDHGHYVHAPGQLLVDQIAGRIALRPNSTHLLVGGIGSGKTTQLLVAQKQLEDVGDLAVCYVDVSRYTDISQVEPGVLMTIVALELADLIPSPMDASIQAALKSLEMIAFDHTTTHLVNPRAANNAMLDISRNLFSLRQQTMTHKGLLRKVQEDNPTGNSKLENVFQTILQAVTQHVGKTLVVLIDGLDRLDDTQKFSQMIRTDLQAMKALGIGTVIVGPILFIHSAYQDAKDLIDHLYYQPCFDVEKSAPARKFFADVIETRLSEPGFFARGSLNLLVRQSGGVLRDLITLTQSAIEEAYIAGDQNLEQRHIDKAVQTLARAKIMGISEAALTILRHHLQNKDFVLGSPESFQLLTSRRIIEYDYPNYRYVVHPAIVPLLQPVAASA
ncbi:MAG: hypothetical protein HC860_00845 [Alkalinema sp. RU_4_3]|nr:hypothetical protein [Alkalinema sp. RU_4_3]